MLTTSRIFTVVLANLVLATASHAALVTFSGTIVNVGTDTGTGQLAGTTVGTGFSASFTYPDTAGPSTISEPDEASYELTGTASLTRSGGLVISGTEININIQNNRPLESDAADQINALINPDPPAVGGALIDNWSLGALQSGAFETDTTPGEGGDTETLFNGVLIEMVMLSLDNTLFNDLAYRPLPPGFSDVPVRAFLLTEADAAGFIVFEAVGLLDDVTAVPAPAAFWLLATGVLVLPFRRRQTDSRRNPGLPLRQPVRSC